MASLFAGKNIVIGVTGSIASFKVAGWVSDLAKEEAQVSVVMTEAAKRFITPLTFSALSGLDVHCDMFAQGSAESMHHISLGREADLLVIAPASANTIAKLAAGICDNLLTTSVLAARCAVVVFPAMNSRMYAHPATRNNIAKLREMGYRVIEPDCGTMACKEEGQGRLVEWDYAREILAQSLAPQDFGGVRMVVTAGPTREAIDPARFLSNRSSGKMGYCLARCGARRGAEVVLVSGPTTLETPPGVKKISVQSAQEMYEAVVAQAQQSQVIIKAAAVADYRPEKVYEHKVKKGSVESSLRLVSTTDILKSLGTRKSPDQVLVGFAAESRNLHEEGKKKLIAKNLDLIAINDISKPQTGFEVDTNQVVLLDNQGYTQLPHTTKLHTADLILDRILTLLKDR
ncbi:bifunctional phosphopantothenoylcysteine decarboxylase/phosphopantothenate--cysteine ligase CoaBC [Desulforhopalus singaporensis]|uniref:Coenzyme A biosynthesis bifunctional protein CoaBC n=1 Tax=Desulforhopalus singaporensis TaxID=91360 RepID=A0A1H0QMX6_9BACT|nr:bifunctional phosphopantothenoylcysteine decarboxylase/phosphopantothenate--cysteine ligase CoaBC [Desulforhopalus singaporensis]SDP18096.1 Phosphopantothenate-cysteine ligase /Phosphopantothenoylcysteine decarboxylase [Desulforhopalus singaporensis]